MNMIIPDEGKKLLLYWALGTNGSDLEDFILDLFQNNVVVADASTFTDFTLSSFPGYVNVPIARADFGVVSIVAHQGTITAAGPVEFSCTGGGGQQAFGWILWGSLSGKVIAGQNFDSARTFVAGTTESLDPFTIKDQTLH